MHAALRVPSGTLSAPRSRLGDCNPTAFSAAPSWTPAPQRSAVHLQQKHRSDVAAALHAQRSAQLCRAAAVPAADPACAPANAADTSLGSAAWRQFAQAVSGEWSGIAVTYDATGEAQELPYQYVPQAFREWGAVPKDWHTQCSTLADDAGMLTKLKRLYPIVGCEEDAVAFEEQSSRSLRSEERHAAEPKTVLPDGSYSTGPRTLARLTAARFEHCLVSEPERRARIVFNIKRGDASQPWRLVTLEQHVERRTADYDGGASLEACGYNMTDVTGEPKTEAQQLAGGQWDVTSHAAWDLEEGGEAFCCCSAAAPDRLELPDGALLLHGRMWAAVCSAADSGSGSGDTGSGNGSGSSGSSSLALEAGVLLEGGRCIMARRAFDGDRLAVASFVAAAKQ